MIEALESPLTRDLESLAFDSYTLCSYNDLSPTGDRGKQTDDVPFLDLGGQL